MQRNQTTKKRQRITSSVNATIDSGYLDLDAAVSTTLPRRNSFLSPSPGGFNDSSTADILLRLFLEDSSADVATATSTDDSSSDEVHVYLHSSALCRAKYFSALLSDRWCKDDRNSVRKVNLGVSPSFGSIRSHLNVIKLLYVDDLSSEILSVSSAISILHVAVKLLDLVTRFKCGGFSVGFLTSHAILDGKAACEMFLNLVALCKGEPLKFPVICNNRTSIKARNPPKIIYPHNEYIILPKISSLPTAFTTSYEAAPSPLIFVNKYSHKLFKFNVDMISELKHKSNDTRCTTFEAMVAHIWKQRTKAVFNDELSSVSSLSTTVLFAVDIRSIITPNLPTGFVGNAVVTAFATSKVTDLVKRPISHGVKLIKEAKQRITEEYVRSVIDWLEIYRGIPATNYNGNFYVSAWWKLPFGELDFGYGKPVHVGPVVAGNDEFVLLLSEGNGDGVNVWMSLEVDKMNKFVNYVFDL